MICGVMFDISVSEAETKPLDASRGSVFLKKFDRRTFKLCRLEERRCST
jgi:hypothetical protein